MKKNVFKIVLLGDSAVGKSSIANMHVNKQFFSFQEPTIGAAFLTSEIEIENSKIKLEIWDTAGQERYRSLAPMYYRGAMGAIVVYDITSIDSLNGAKTWVHELKRKTLHCNIILVGNKADLTDSRKVKYADAKNFASENELMFLEVSAKQGEKVDLIFEKIAKRLINIQKEKGEDNIIDFNNCISTNNSSNKKFKCC